MKSFMLKNFCKNSFQLYFSHYFDVLRFCQKSNYMLIIIIIHENKWNFTHILTYTLHLDSHHRFIQNWDEELINMYNKCKEMGSDKPLITGYLPHFDPDTEEFTQEI